MKIWVSNT